MERTPGNRLTNLLDLLKRRIEELEAEAKEWEAKERSRREYVWLVNNVKELVKSARYFASDYEAGASLEHLVSNLSRVVSSFNLLYHDVKRHVREGEITLHSAKRILRNAWDIVEAMVTLVAERLITALGLF